MKHPIGSFTWADLTVENATEIRDFYAAVIGYSYLSIDMGGYEDYCMNSPDDKDTKSGICHAKGLNKDLPPTWLVYFYVADLDASLETLKSRGGKILSGPRDFDGSRFAIIQDPAGACCALYEQAKDQ